MSMVVIGEICCQCSLRVTSVDGPKYTVADGVGWLKSFVRESVVETDDTAAGGSKLIVPYHHNS